MGDALLNIDQFLADLLLTDDELTAEIGDGLYPDAVPPGAVYPLLIVADYLPAVDRKVIGSGRPTERIFTRASRLIKAITTGEDGSWSYAQGSVIMQRVETLITGSVASKILGVSRRQQVRYPEIIGETRYNHYGHIYDIWAKD